MVKIGRALGGLCVGIASLCLPVYLGETVQPEVRGTLGLLPTALGNIGQHLNSIEVEFELIS
jgi:facilitated trehalose transporter